MDYFDFVFTFNKTAMNNNRDFINETIDKITGDSRKEIEDILKPEYVNPAAVEEDKLVVESADNPSSVIRHIRISVIRLSVCTDIRK